MKLYRVHYGNDVKQGIYRGNTGKNWCRISDIIDRMGLGNKFRDISRELHAPSFWEFDIEPNKDSLFYFKESFINSYNDIFDNLIATASQLDITVNITTIDLDTIQSYQCIYQDENQMCLNIK